nr:hypothetical protein [Tanacetum cinerariifolium]
MALAYDELFVGKNHARMAPTDPKSSKDSGLKPQTPLPPLNNLQEASPSFEVQMLMDKKINSTQKTQEAKYVSSQPESSKSVNLSKEDHMTSYHNIYIGSLKSSQNYKAQPYQYASLSKQILKSTAKPYPPCSHYGFNDHRPDDCRNYLEYVQSTFLNGKLKEEFYVKQPPGFESILNMSMCEILGQSKRITSYYCEKNLQVPERYFIYWSENPSPLADDFEVRPLKEYKIKFIVMNEENPLTLDFKNFVASTGLDYNKGTYVSHPSPKAIKAELAKLVKNAILLDRTPINSIQQLIAYCLLTGTHVDIGETIYSDIITRLTSKSRQKYVSYPRFVSRALEVLLGSNYTLDENFGSSHAIMSNSNFSKDPSKGPEASRALYKKRNKPMSKKATLETQATPPSVPTKEFDKTQSPLPEGIDAEYQVDKSQSNRLELTSMADYQALLGDDGLKEDSDDEVFKARDKMDEDIQEPKTEETQSHHSTDHTTEEEYQSPSPNKDQPESSNAKKTDASDSKSSFLSESLKPYDNYMPITKRQLVSLEEFINTRFTKYENNDVDLKDLQQILSLFKNDYNKSMRRIFKNIKEVQNAVKEDHALNKKFLKLLKLTP